MTPSGIVFSSPADVSQANNHPSVYLSEKIKFSPTFPRYQDPQTKLWVYQISLDPGLNRVFYYHQYNSNDPDWVVFYNHQLDKQALPRYYRLNLRTGEKILLSDNLCNGEFLNDNYLYVFYHAKKQTIVDGLWHKEEQVSVARQNILTREWTFLCPLPKGWKEEGSITANKTDDAVIFTTHNQTDPKTRRIMLFHMEDNSLVQIYEGNEELQHFTFSPTDPGIFTYINQSASYTVARIGVGSVKQKKIQALQIVADSTGYFLDVNFRGSNFAHPFWSSDGFLCCDILWHKTNPVDGFGLVKLDLRPNPLIPVPVEKQQLGFLPAKHWSAHTNKTTLPDWFVSDGDSFPKNPRRSPPGRGLKIISLFHLLGRKTENFWNAEFFNLASIRGELYNDLKKRPIDCVPHLVAHQEGVIVTWQCNLTGAGPQNTDASHSNIFLIQLPSKLTKQLQLL